MPEPDRIGTARESRDATRQHLRPPGGGPARLPTSRPETPASQLGRVWNSVTAIDWLFGLRHDCFCDEIS